MSDGIGSDVWYCSSSSSFSFFLPFQKFFMLNQARSNVKDPLLLPATLAVSLVDLVALDSLSSLRCFSK